MKSIILTALVFTVCSSVLAAQPTDSPVAPKSVPAVTTPVPAVTEAKSADTQTHISSVPNFCGQADVVRMLMNTEIGKKLRLQQQEATRQAIAQMVADGKIPAKQSQQPTATNPKSAQSVEVPATTPDVKAPQK